MKKKNWVHKEKYKGKVFFGYYTFLENRKHDFRDRTFNLKEIGGKRIFSFESWQVAVKFGFKLNK